MSKLKCAECDAYTLDTCPGCHKTPLCADCRQMVGECGDCTPDDDEDDDAEEEDDVDDFDDLDDDEEDDDDGRT